MRSQRRLRRRPAIRRSPVPASHQGRDIAGWPPGVRQCASGQGPEEVEASRRQAGGAVLHDLGCTCVLCFCGRLKAIPSSPLCSSLNSKPRATWRQRCRSLDPMGQPTMQGPLRAACAPCARRRSIDDPTGGRGAGGGGGVGVGWGFRRAQSRPPGRRPPGRKGEKDGASEAVDVCASFCACVQYVCEYVPASAAARQQD